MIALNHSVVPTTVLTGNTRRFTARKPADFALMIKKVRELFEIN